MADFQSMPSASTGRASSRIWSHMIPWTRRIVEIDLSRLDMTVSELRSCVGRFEEEYRPCPQVKIVRGSFDQCDSCAESWIPRQECVFEPKCEGELCDCHFCKRPHLVYAAFYGRKVKIGMTSGSRMAERAIEQGADAIVALVDCENRFRAREMEKDISRLLVLPQRMTRCGHRRSSWPAISRELSWKTDTRRSWSRFKTDTSFAGTG